MKRRPLHRKTQKAARVRREGVVLLITAFVLLIISGTALFAIQQGLWEMRASGTALQGVRTRYVSESFVMGGLACLETPGCLQLNPASDSWRAEYGVPARALDTAPDYAPEPMYEVRPADVSPTAAAPLMMGFSGKLVQSDDEMAPSGGGVAAVYEPDFRFVVEEWVLQNRTAAAGSRNITRYVASCYGELDVIGDVTHGDDTRQNSQSVSVSRVYYQVTQ
jgi:hypothetical protein